MVTAWGVLDGWGGPDPLAAKVNGNEEPTTDLGRGLYELDCTQRRYRVANQYYEGRVPEVFSSARMRRAMAATGVGFTFNFAASVADAVIERLEIAAVSAPDTPDAQSTLDDVWQDNKLDIEARNIMRSACEYGDAYLIVWPDPAGDGDSDGLPGVNVFYNSPLCVRLFYDEENPARKSYAIKRWQLRDQRFRVDLYYPGRIERYISPPRVQHPKETDFVEYTADGEDSTLPNPFGEVPVFHFRTDTPYGDPEHQGAYGPQDAIHKLIVSHMASVDYQAFPQRFALTAPETDSTEAAALDEDEFSFPLDTGATGTNNRDPQSQFTSDPGSLWYMQGITSVGQFAAADPNNFTAPMLTYLRCMAQITNTPLHRIDPTGDAPSGESLRTAEAPFIRKVRDRQLSFGATWREALVFALRVAGQAAEVDVRWAPAASTDDETGWTTAGLKLAAGVPLRQVLMEAGYTADQLDAWSDVDLPLNVDQLAKIGQALASLGTAQNLGAVSPEQVQALITRIIGETATDGAPA